MLKFDAQEAKTPHSGGLAGRLDAIPAPQESPATPRFGLWEGFGVADSFFDPLPDDLVKVFGAE